MPIKWPPCETIKFTGKQLLPFGAWWVLMFNPGSGMFLLVQNKSNYCHCTVQQYNILHQFCITPIRCRVLKYASHEKRKKLFRMKCDCPIPALCCTINRRTTPVLLPGALRFLFLWRSLRSDTRPMLRILSTIRALERLAVIRFRIFPSTSMEITEKTEIKDFAGTATSVKKQS